MAFPDLKWADRTTKTTDGGTSITAIDEPTGTVEDDGLLLFWASDGGPTGVTVDGFWTEIRLVDHTAVSAGCWYGVRGASAPNRDISWTGAEDASASIIRVVDGTFNAANMVDLAEDTLATGVDIDVPYGAMSVVAADRVVIGFHAGDTVLNVICNDTGSQTNPVCSSWTERFDESFTSGGGRASYSVRSADTALTAPDLRETQNATQDFIAIMFAVEPVAAAADVYPPFPRRQNRLVRM